MNDIFTESISSPTKILTSASIETKTGVSVPQIRPTVEVAEEEVIVDVVDEVLDRSWPYFYTEGLVLFSLGMGSLVLPALAGEGFFREIVGSLLVMAGLMKGIRSFKAREISGFLPSVVSAVLTLVIGTLLTVYSQDSFLNARVAICLFFMIQTVTHFIFSGQFYDYPYAGGFKFVALTAFVMMILLSFGLLKEEALFPSIFTGTLLMLEGSLIFAVALGLEKMSKGLPYLHTTFKPPSKFHNK